MPVDPIERRSLLREAVLGAYLLALVYGTLYPFEGWRSTGQSGLEFVFEAWPRYWTAFDVAANVLVYALPGALTASLLRDKVGTSLRTSLLLATIAGCALSFTLEALQSFIPVRVPSRLDWIANTAGTLAGALAHAAAGARARRQWRWFPRESSAGDGAVGGALLAGWLALQMHPQRLLFGNGDVLGPMLSLIGALDLALPGVPVQTASVGVLAPAGALRLSEEFSVLTEAAGAASAVLAIGMLVRETFASSRPRALFTGIVISAAMAVKSVADLALLGPGQAFAWLSAGAQGGLVTGTILIGLMASARRRSRLRIAIVALGLTALLTNIFPVDAYHESMLARWDQGAWRNFDGLLHALAVVWPFAAISWCAARMQALRG